MGTSRELMITMKVQTGDAKASVEGLEAEVKSAAQNMAKDQIAAVESVDKVRKQKEISESERIKRRAKEIGDAARIEMAVALRNSEDKVKLAQGDEAKIQSIRKNAFDQLQNSIGQSLKQLRALGDGGALAFESLENKLRNMSKRIETGNTAFGQLIQNTKNLQQVAGQSGFQALNASLDDMKKKMGPMGGALQGLGVQMGGLVSSTISGGDATQGLISGLGAAAGAFGPFGQAVSVAIGILGALIGKYETAEEAAKRTTEEYQASVAIFNTVNQSFTQMAESIVNGDIVGAAEEINGSMAELSAISVEAANELQTLTNAPGERTSAELARIDELMGEINAKASEEMLVKQYDAALASLENIGNVIGDIANENDAWYESVLEFLVPLAGVSDRMEDIKNLTADSSKAGIEGMKARGQLAKIENEYQKVFIENLRAGMSLEETMKGVLAENVGLGEAELQIIKDQATEAQKQFTLEEERAKKKDAGFIAEQKALKAKTEADEKAHKAELERIETAKKARLDAIEEAKKATERAQSAVDANKETLAKEKQKIQESFEDGNITQGMMEARIKAIEAIAAQLDSVVINKDTDVKALSDQFEESMHQYNRTAKKAEEEARKLAAETKKAEEEAKKEAEEAAKRAQADAHKAVLKEYDLQAEQFKIKEEQIAKEKEILKDLNNFSKSLDDARTSHIQTQKAFIESLSVKSFTATMREGYADFKAGLDDYWKGLSDQTAGITAEIADKQSRFSGMDARRTQITRDQATANTVYRDALAVANRNADNAAARRVEDEYVEKAKKLEDSLHALSDERHALEQDITNLQTKLAGVNKTIADRDTSDADRLAKNAYWLNQIQELNNQRLQAQQELSKTVDPAEEERLQNEAKAIAAKAAELDKLIKVEFKRTDSTLPAAQMLRDMSTVGDINSSAVVKIHENILKINREIESIKSNELLKAMEGMAKVAEEDPTLANLEKLADAQAGYQAQLAKTLATNRTELTKLDATSAEYATLADSIRDTSKELATLEETSAATSKAIVDAQKAIAKEREEAIQSVFGRLKEGLEGIGSADISAAFDSVFSSVKNLTSATATASEKMQAGIGVATGLAQALAAIPDTVERYQKTFKTAGAGGVVEDVSGDVSKIGSALMGSGVPPLQAAGAALLAIGIVGGIVGKLIQAIETPEKRALKASERRLASQEQITEEYGYQKEYVEALNALESRLADTARERLQILQDQREAAFDNAAEVEAQLVRAKAALAALKSDAIGDIFQLGLIATGESIIAQLEAQLVGLREQSALAEEVAGFTSEMLASEIARTKAVVANYESVEDMTDKQQTELNLAKEYLGLLENEVLYRKELLALEKQSRAELQGTRDLLTEIALRANKYASAMSNANHNFKDQVNDVNKSLGTSFKTADEAMKFFNKQGFAYFRNLSDEQRKYISSLMAGYQSVGDAVFEDQENLINLRKGAGKITDEQAQQQLLDLYNAELARLTDINATEEEKLQIEIKIRDIMAEQNGEADIASEKLTKLVHQRQEMIKAMRGGTGNASQVAAQTELIRAELAAMGKSPDEIAAFIATLPGRATGGPMTEGLYKVGEQGTEFAMNARAVDKYGMDFMQRLNAMQFPAPSMGGMGAMAATIVQNRINTVVNNNMTMNGTTSESLMKWFAGEMTKMRNDIPRIVQKSITSGAVNVAR